MGYEMSAIPDDQVGSEREREEVSGASPLLHEQLRAFEQLMARQRQVVTEFEHALVTGWQRFLFGPRSRWRRATCAARELEQLHGAVLDAAATLSRTALAASGEIPAVVHLSAEEYDGMRRQHEHPDPAQVERVGAFLAGTPSPPRA